MTEKTVEIAIPLLLPDVQDEQDACFDLLQNMLDGRKGILRTHIEIEHEPVDLCIHYDPNLISLALVNRLAHHAGSELSDGYMHESIPFDGLDSADSADVVAAELNRLPGMLHANVNYAAGLVFVAFDSSVLQHEDIELVLRRFGARPLYPEELLKEETSVEESEGHLSIPGFLPMWIRTRWPLVLVGLSGVFLLIGWAGETVFNLPSGVALVFFLLAYLAGGYDIATHALPSVLHGKLDTDVLMLAAAGGAAILGEWAEGAFLLFLFSLGHTGEHYALDRARDAINSLSELMPKTAHTRRNGRIVETPIERLAIGEIVIVRPGDRIPVDGVVSQGTSTVDQSPVTGESIPILKRVTDEVYAGTINQEAALDVEVTRLAKDATLSRVMRMVAEAQSQQSPTQQFTRRFTARFVPAVLALVGLVAVVPPIFGWLTFSQSFYRAMLLLVAASPCALAIGAPAAVLAGIAQAARNGVLIKGGAHLENLGNLRAMAFDKTGTVTAGEFQVTDIVTFDGTSREEILRMAGAAEQQTNHPLANAVLQAARDFGQNLPHACKLEIIPGRGVRCQVDGQPVLAGSLRLFNEEGYYAIDRGIVQTVERLEAVGKTVMAVSRKGSLLGLLAFADVPRPGVREVLAHLRQLGVGKLIMLTGDNTQVAGQIAQALGVTDVEAGLMPEHKLETVRRLQREYGGVAMVGDGINDAPALAAATVGIAMGGAGTAIALETADVALMVDDLGKLPFAVGLSRASRAIIRQNLFIALGVIGALVLTSVLGWVALSWAVVFHEGSTILVVLNALRLLSYRSS